MKYLCIEDCYWGRNTKNFCCFKKGKIYSEHEEQSKQWKQVMLVDEITHAHGLGQWQSRFIPVKVFIPLGWYRLKGIINK